MSIFFEFDVGPSGRRFRRAVDGDKQDIELFLDREESEKLFGAADIGSLIELSTLSICMINENKEVVGFMALCDHPNVPGVEPNDWETWIRNMFQKYYLSRNTLFVHFMCCKDSVINFFLEEAFLSVFQNDMYLQQIALFVSSDCDAQNITRYQSFKKRNMYKYSAKRTDDSETMPHQLYAALRPDYCPKLKIRRAVEEDNDDIVEILDTKCPNLKELYGDYYISELVGRHPESTRTIIVPEYQEHAVGVMCLNSDINYRKLQTLYELRPHHGLIKATPLEKEQLRRGNVLLTTFGDPIMLGKLGPFDRPLNYEESTNASDSYYGLHSKEYLPRESSITVKRKQSKVIFKRGLSTQSQKMVYFTSDEYSNQMFMHSPTPSQTTEYSLTCCEILEEDPFEYDIVNIDKSLLSITDAFSNELFFLKLGENSGEKLVLREGETSKTSFLSRFEDCQETIKEPIRLEPEVIRKRLKSIHKTSTSELDSEQFFFGEPNAFMIELFGLRDDVDERNGFDLLEAAFEIMKNYDYCIIRVPSADRSFPLLQHFCYVPMKAKVNSTYSLYIAHRSSVLGKLRAREAEFMDIPFIARFLANIEGTDTMCTIEHSIVHNKGYKAYVFMSGLSLIGIGILEPPKQLNFLRTKFNLDPYHNHKYHLAIQGEKSGISAVKVILIYPVFEVHFRFFAREMMRLSGSSSLIWMTAYRNKWVAHKANSMASAMIPLVPRKSELDYTKVPELSKMYTLAKHMMAFNAWFLDKKLTSVPMATVCTKILVLGASRTAMGFLNALIFSNASSYLTFTNVTLISINGLPYSRNTNSAVEAMFLKFRNTSDKYLKSVPYTYYLNTVNGTVMEINKPEKFVTLTDGRKYDYDLLFLLFGKQYQHPEYLNPLIEQKMKCTHNSPYVRLDIPRIHVEPDLVNYNTPSNVFIINHVVEAKKALKYVKQYLNEGFDFTVLVYGATIHAYCCLTALLDMHVPAENIVFVEPFPPENRSKTRVSVFHNANVDVTVGEIINSLKIKVYRSYYFQSWSVIGDVTHVEFLSHFQMIKLECSAFFYYGKRGVNTQGFLAVNKCGTAYDGGILIDHQFRTKDPSIYAGGPATAYYRKYYAEDMKQKYYDSYEVGEKLGTQIRNQLDPLFPVKTEERKRSSVRFSNNPLTDMRFPGSTCSNGNKSTLFRDENLKEKLLVFSKPKVSYCRLPGGLQYLEVRSPGKKIPHQYVQSLDYNGIVMETFKRGYFKLHLTTDLVVDGITCLTKEKYPLENFKNLYGQSSVVLNHVHLRYTTKKLDDFYEFFHSPWASFLYHDQADELFAMVKELWPKGHSKGMTITEALRNIAGKFKDAEFITSKLRNNFEASPYVEAVIDYVIEWLSENDVLLPMYLQPSERADYIHDMGRNPVFKKKKTSLTKLISKIF